MGKMKWRKTIIFLMIAIFLFSIAAVSASDVDDMEIASEDANQIELSASNEMDVDNLKTSEENTIETQAKNNKSMSAALGSKLLDTDTGTFSGLYSEIGSGGNIELQHDYYTYDWGRTIQITLDNTVIDGKGAIIDMDGSTDMQPFYVTASGVTFKNLTIQNANCHGYGGAIYFTSSATSGTVTNCNFTNNTADNSGAVYFQSTGEVTNCNFTNNTATSLYGGAVYFQSTGNVTNCNFTNNTAKDYGGAVYFQSTGNVTNCNFTNNTATNLWGGAVYFQSTGEVTNCNFTNNTARDYGGAVYFLSTGNVTNCNFTNNTGRYGGAVMIYSGNVTNCNFTNNTARSGGAVFFSSNGEVTNCNFTNNTATYYDGGAVYFQSTGEVTNCNFVDNSATNRAGAIFSYERYTTADTCIFKRNSGEDVNVVIYPPTLDVDDFTTFYGSGEKLTFDLKTNISNVPVTNGNISISVYFKDNETWVVNSSCLSGEGWIPDLPVGSYIAVFNTEYEKFQEINRTVTIEIPNVEYYINVSSLTSNNRTVNITAKSDIPKDILWDGKLLFILSDGTADGMVIEANYAGNGAWWAEHAFNEYSVYQVSAAYDGLDDVTVKEGTITIIKADSTLKVDNMAFDYDATGSTNVSFTNASGVNASVVGQPNAVVKVNGTNITVSGLNAGTYNLTVTTIVDDDHNPVTVNATITVNKLQTELSGNAITATYNVNSDLVVTLKDSNGNPVSGAKLIVDLNGAKTYTTDSNGQIKVSTKGLAPKTYTARITFDGNTNYEKSAKNVKVTVKKATPKLTAKKKTFKTSVKTKKYTITLKDNTGKAIKKAKVTLKVKGKTYKATTNSKGKAVFKIKNLKKKGTFKATITYKGNKYYNKITKKANIKVIVTFKTVSKGSKDKSTVKEIQQALKDHGYYLSYKGHYLKVDGKFQSCTERSVKQFQHDKGLKVTGKVDEKTAKKLGLI